MFILSIVLITLALVFYTIGVWSERIQGGAEMVAGWSLCAWFRSRHQRHDANVRYRHERWSKRP